MKSFVAIALLGLAIALGGCADTPPKRDPEYAPVKPIEPPPMPTGDGAIFHAGYARAWVESARARQVGDLITVLLVEKTDAAKTSSSTVKKSNDQQIANPTILGSPVQFGVPNNWPLANTTTNNLQFAFQSSTDFSGEGDAAQGNKLTGEVTVTVVQVLSNGNMMVRGEKRIGINQGNEYIRIAGIVRPEDIDAQNRVPSTKIADPTLQYVGDGQVASAAVMGWLTRFFISALWPF